jgi:hypothetical protein
MEFPKALTGRVLLEGQRSGPCCQVLINAVTGQVRSNSPEVRFEDMVR